MSDDAAIENKISKLIEKLHAIHIDVAAIKKTCVERGRTCLVRLQALDNSLRGNGGSGVNSRVTTLEAQIESLKERDSKKDKFAYVVIGILSTMLIGLGLAYASNLLRP